MKHFVIFFLLFYSFTSFSQEKTNYNKNVYPLIKEGKYTEALPLLEKFLQEKPEHINANYWCAKILEIEGKKTSNPDQIQKAKEHYAFCFNNATELEMTMATAGRYPDVSGIESTERLNNFKVFLKSKYQECETLERKILQENENKKREQEQANIQSQKQIEQDTKVRQVEYKSTTIDEFILKTGLTDVKKILGTYGESLFDEGGDWNFTFEYNTIDSKPMVNGKLTGDFRGQLSNFSGEIHNGLGYVIFYFENNDIYATQAIKCYFDQNKCTKVRCETLLQTSELYFFETNSIVDFQAERFLEITDNPYDVKLAEQKQLGKRIWPITRFEGFFDSEEEGADITMKGFSFLTVFKRDGQYYQKEQPILFSEENVNPTIITTLKSPTTIGKYYELTGDAYKYESEVFSNIDSVFKLKSVKEVFIFIPEFYASKYKETISSEDLTSLNALAKKWHESILNGNYEAYKSVTAKGAQWNLEEFTKFNKEFQKLYGTSNPNSKYTFQKSNSYLVTGGDVVISRESKFNELKSTGSDLKKLVILFGVYRQDSKEERSLIFVKENGAWKILGGEKMTSSDRDINKYKAYQVLNKENLTVCNCIEKVISGDVYNAEKCAFYFTYKKIDDKAVIFEECFKTLNYCDYDKQCNSMELGLGYSNSQKSKECRGQ